MNQTNLTELPPFEMFGGLYQTRFSKFYFGTFSFVISLIDLLLLYGIVWHEHFGSDQKRTLVNKLVTSVCLSFSAVLIVCMSDWIRYFWGRLPQSICLTQVLHRIFTEYIILRTRVILIVMPKDFWVQQLFFSIKLLIGY
jgi:hypothetical protein